MKQLTFTVCLGGASLLFVGCQEKSAPPAAKPQSPPAAASSDDAAETHAHGEGPHGGAVADWGGGAYHVEFTVDHDAKKATVYILGSDGKTAKPIKTEDITLIIDEPATEFELKAEPQEGEADGMSSRFSGVHDTIGVVREFAGTIRGEVDGTPYFGEFAEVAEHAH